jgi:putative adhesin
MQMTPGRIAALAAGVPLTLALIGWTGYAFVALAGQASYPISQAIPLHGGGVTATIGGSDLTLRQGGVSTPELVGTVHYTLFKPSLTVTQAGADTSVNFHCRDNMGNCDLNATLQVPSRIGVTLATGGGNISVPVFTGSVELLSGGGDVMSGSLGGTVQVQTDGGNVSADSLSGSLDLQTGGGDLNANTVSGGSLQASMGGGNLDVQAMADADANIGSGGGDVTLTFTQVPRNLQISTAGGNIVVVLPAGSTAYDLQANADGGNSSVSDSVPIDSRSSDALILDSEGGDITVTEAS